MTLEAYITKVDYIIDHWDKIIDKAITKVDYYAWRISNSLFKVVSSYTKWSMNNYYSIYRRISWPTGKIVLRVWKYFKFLFTHPDLLKRPGIHTIMGPPGCGKSLLGYLSITESANDTGKAAFVNTRFEKSQPDENGRMFKIHRFFKLDEMFSVREQNGSWIGYQKRELNPKHYRSILYDEVHTIFNNRQNRTREYMLLFVPFMTNLVKYRHKGFKSIFLLTQLTADVQLMTISDYVHKPETILDINYQRWVQNGKFELVPVRIDIKSFKYHDGKLTLYKTWSKPVDHTMLDTYNTYAYKHTSKLPMLD